MQFRIVGLTPPGTLFPKNKDMLKSQLGITFGPNMTDGDLYKLDIVMTAAYRQADKSGRGDNPVFTAGYMSSVLADLADQQSSNWTAEHIRGGVPMYTFIPAEMQKMKESGAMPDATDQEIRTAVLAVINSRRALAQAAADDKT